MFRLGFTLTTITTDGRFEYLYVSFIVAIDPVINLFQVIGLVSVVNLQYAGLARH